MKATVECRNIITIIEKLLYCYRTMFLELTFVSHPCTYSCNLKYSKAVKTTQCLLLRVIHLTFSMLLGFFSNDLRCKFIMFTRLLYKRHLLLVVCVCITRSLVLECKLCMFCFTWEHIFDSQMASEVLS